MAFTKLFAFAKKKAATQNVQATLDLEGVFAMVEDVHVRMRFNKKGELVRLLFTLSVMWEYRTDCRWHWRSRTPSSPSALRTASLRGSPRV